MLRFEMKKRNTILTEKQHKYQHYHPKKLKNKYSLVIEDN